jgi:hypothetical protein
MALLVVLAMVVVVAWVLSCDQPPDTATQRAAISLRAIRRRMEVAQCKIVMQGDAARLRRELREALDEQEQL